MLDKLKNLGDAAKGLFLYLLTPIFLVVILVVYLFGRNRELEDALKSKDGEEKLKELQGEQKQIDDNASDAVSNYEKLRGAYLSGDHPELRQRNQSSTGPGSNSGSGVGAGGSDAKNPNPTNRSVE